MDGTPVASGMQEAVPPGSPRAAVQVMQPGDADLGALAAATGGAEPAPEASSLTSFLPVAGGGGGPAAVVRVWPWLVLLALLTYLFEILYRRGGLRREARA